MVFKTRAQEVVSDFNSRANDGRVLVNPDIDSIKLRKTETIQFCCGIAFLTEDSFIKHQQQKTQHTKPIDLKNVRMALNTRSSSEFWQTRKRRAAKTFNDDGEEVEGDEATPKVDKVEDEDAEEGQKSANGDGGGDEDDMTDTEPDAPPPPQPKKATNSRRRGRARPKKRRSRPAYSSARKRQRRKGKMRCEQCEMDISITNMNRHYKTCHNPAHEFTCRYCSCRFEVAYGRMVHEVRNHEANLTAAGYVPRSTVRKTALKVKKKLVQISKPTLRVKVEPRPVRHPPPPPPPTAVPDHKQIVPEMTPEQKADCDSHIRKLDKSATDTKGRFECTICLKTFHGSRNAHDHMNSHYGLKPYKCPLCDFYFSFRSNVARHIRTCHTENTEFVCPYGCGCSMHSDTSLKVHMNLVCTLRHQYQNRSPASASSGARSVVNVKVEGGGGGLPQANNPPSMRAMPSSTAIKMQNYSNPAPPPSTSAPSQEASRLGNRVLKEKFLHLEVSPGIYRCEQCGKTITGSGNFRDHLNIHANIKPHKCPKCYMTFTFKSNIKRHLASAHVLNGQFRCPMKCGCSMDNQHALQSHLNKCKIEIVKHRRVPPTASPSKMRPGTSSSIAVNRPSQTTTTVSPPKLQVSMPPPPPLQKMIPRPPPLTPAPARFALPQYSNTNSNSNPMAKSAIAIALGKYQCNVCGKSVSCQRNLSNHMLIHENIKPCKCLICGLFFRTLDTLKKHKLRSHAANSPYKCSLCTCKFSQLQGLNMHTNIHHNHNKTERAGTIAPPSKTNHHQVVKMEIQQQQQQMEQNMDEDYEDEEDSGQIVTPRVDLSRARTREGYWKCHICGKILKKPLHLKNHMRIHSGEKPFQCQICGNRFRLASTLYDHKKSSHRGGKHECDVCPCTFETNLGLSRHKGIFHNSQAHDDYVQRKVRLIREKAVKSAFNLNQNRARPIILSSQYRKPNLVHQTSSSSSPQKQQLYNKVGVSILQKRLNVQPQLVKQQNSGSTPAATATTNRANANANAMFQCGHCALSLPSLNALSEHQKVHQSPKPIPSPSAYSTPPIGPSPRTCPICKQSIHGRTHYNKHMTGCHSGGPYRCDFCPCTFDSQGNLSRHHTLMHPNILNRSNTGKGASSTASTPASSSNVETVTYTTNDYEEGDVVTYADDEVYDDQDQQQQEWDWGQVEATYSTNTPEYQGEEEDGATAGDEMPPYEITPAGKRYTCPDCGKSFDKMNRYKLHVTIHTNVKPYKCPYCVQCFRLPGILATHVKKSHGSGEFHCQLCSSRFTSAKGLSVHEFVYHKGGRAEREVLRGQVGQIPVLKKPSALPKRILPAPNKVTNIQYSVNSASTSRPQFAHQKQVLPTLANRPMPPTTTTAPRPVKLKCHICAQIFFGTTSLKEHMKEHSNQFQSRPQQQQRQPQQFANQVRGAQNFQTAPQRNNSQYTNSYPRMSNGQGQQLQYSSTGRGEYIQTNPGTSRSYQEIYEDDEEQGTFEIVGYENGYEDGDSMEMEEQGPDMEYVQYDEGGQQLQQQEEYYEEGEENYDYIPAEDHLEVTYEENNFGYDDNDDDENGYGVEVEMGEDNSQQGDNNGWNQAQTMDIYCKGCETSFDSRDAFAYHVENNPTGTHRCSYCCVKGLTVETLPDHIDQVHPMDEIEFIESHVYSDS